MKLSIAFLLVAALLVAVAMYSHLPKSVRAPERRSPPLTKNEQPMFFRLRDTFPDHVVLAQVAFSALLTSRDRATRNTFDRKVADFVLCTKAFEVVAVIELDDSSHRSKSNADRSRDALLTRAGYRVLRFPRTPDADALHVAVFPPATPTATA